MSTESIKYAGAKWMLAIKNAPAASALGIKVMNILGQVYQGIYHIDKTVLNPKIHWDEPYSVGVTVSGVLSTFDFPLLTVLVLCCQRAEVSVVIDGSFKGYTKLVFAPNPGGSETLMFLSINESSPLKLRLAQCTHIKEKLRDVNGGSVYSTEPLGWHNLLAMIDISHRTATRFQVVGRSPRTLEIMVTQREREGSTDERHPTLAEHRAILRPYYWDIDYTSI